MKKLFGILALPIISIQPNNVSKNVEKKLPGGDKTKARAFFTGPEITLNGVVKSKAIPMIDNFERLYENDKNTSKSITTWYSLAQIKAINDLLVAEYNQTRRPDGVRMYFGCNEPTTGTGTKLKPTIFLVSTEKRDPLVDGKSDHVDYYDHLPDHLPSAEIGQTINDHADDALNKGALLYGPMVLANVKCDNPGTHYVNGVDAYNAVQRRREDTQVSDVSAYNTRSEWFSLCFINSLFNAICFNSNALSGLRIYLGKRIMDDGEDRDVFVLVPTYRVGLIDVDFYECIENLQSFVCDVPGEQIFMQKQKIDLRATFANIDGYDKGELCPTNCN